MDGVNIFLSYCWDDSELANHISDYFKNNQKVKLHRDVIKIGKWRSIKEYMQSISDMDYTILLISDAYLKSANCMYEVLELMKDRNYRNKIFPAITNAAIYKPVNRARYVKHWENEFIQLEKELKKISVENLGNLNEDLKTYQNIASSMAEFLDVISDMNNPEIQEVTLGIEEKLNQSGLIGCKQEKNEKDLFDALGLQKSKISTEPTDIEVNRFMKESFDQILKLISRLCQQYQSENSEVQIQSDQVDTRTAIYQFYRNGQLVKGVKLVLGNMFGKRESIGVSDCTNSFRNSNNSWNSIYNAKIIDGKLKLYAIASLTNRQKSMTVEEVVADIWKNYVQIYLER